MIPLIKSLSEDFTNLKAKFESMKVGINKLENIDEETSQLLEKEEFNKLPRGDRLKSKLRIKTGNEQVYFSQHLNNMRANKQNLINYLDSLENYCDQIIRWLNQLTQQAQSNDQLLQFFNTNQNTGANFSQQLIQLSQSFEQFVMALNTTIDKQEDLIEKEVTLGMAMDTLSRILAIIDNQKKLEAKNKEGLKQVIQISMVNALQETLVSETPVNAFNVINKLQVLMSYLDRVYFSQIVGSFNENRIEDFQNLMNLLIQHVTQTSTKDFESDKDIVDFINETLNGFASKSASFNPNVAYEFVDKKITGGKPSKVQVMPNTSKLDILFRQEVLIKIIELKNYLDKTKYGKEIKVSLLKLKPTNETVNLILSQAQRVDAGAITIPQFIASNPLINKIIKAQNQYDIFDINQNAREHDEFATQVLNVIYNADIQDGANFRQALLNKFNDAYNKAKNPNGTPPIQLEKIDFSPFLK